MLSKNEVIYTGELELSIIIHRLGILFELLLTYNATYFYPALVYNESFWSMTQPTKISLLESLFSGNLKETLGSDPRFWTSLRLDKKLVNYLNISKSVFLSNSKYDYSKFLLVIYHFDSNQLKFSSFGDVETSPILYINRYIPADISGVIDINKFHNYLELLPKLIVFKLLKEKAKYENILFLVNKYNYKFLREILNLLLDIYQISMQRLLEIKSFSLAYESMYLEELQKNLKTDFNLNDLDSFTFLMVELNSIKIRTKYDYIIAIEVLSTLPADIFYKKTENEYYVIQGRPSLVVDNTPEVEDQSVEKKKPNNTDTVTIKNSKEKGGFWGKIAKNNDETKIGEDEALLRNESVKEGEIGNFLKSFGNPMSKIEYEKLMIEMTYIPIEKSEVQKLLIDDSTVPDGLHFSMSIEIAYVLNEMVMAAKKSNVEIIVIDYKENPFLNANVEFPESPYGYYLSAVNFNFYSVLLTHFSDLNCNVFTTKLNRELDLSIYGDENCIVSTFSLIQILKDEANVFASFFDQENFTLVKDVKSISKKLSFREGGLKIGKMSLGVGKMMYSSGFDKFKESLLEISKQKRLTKSHQELIVNLKMFKSGKYEKEYFYNCINLFLQKIQKIKSYFSINLNAQYDVEMNHLIAECGLDKLKVVKVLQKHKERLKLYEDVVDTHAYLRIEEQISNEN